ncbi:hypothetical protein BT63DRAFT_455042 [Microthyrium microscopicum]|uniref:RRM domain-containing protein n=1 Tax=Microthyrium microscopicum TaxID=703497 RepID=A0A6A6UC98_9PEZI|nr:hypothetical protein BT63DRAFT_455042 [Microthyrium microscopicum]
MAKPERPRLTAASPSNSPSTIALDELEGVQETVEDPCFLQLHGSKKIKSQCYGNKSVPRQDNDDFITIPSALQDSHDLPARLCVGNLAAIVRPATLGHFFIESGFKINSVDMYINLTLNNFCHAIVEFKYSTEAERAMNSLHGYVLVGRPMVFQFSEDGHFKASEDDILPSKHPKKEKNNKWAKHCLGFERPEIDDRDRCVLVGDLPTYVPRQFVDAGLRLFFCGCNLEAISDCLFRYAIKGSQPRQSQRRGLYCFVRFRTIQDAGRAVLARNGAQSIWSGARLTVDPIESSIFGVYPTMQANKFISH